MQDSEALSWQHLAQAAARARLAAEHERAIELYSAALSQPNAAWPDVVALHIERAQSAQALGDFAAIERDLVKLAQQAAAAGDAAALAAVLTERATNLLMTDDLQRCVDLGQQALAAATRSGRADLQRRAYLALGEIQIEAGNLESARDSLDAAAQLPSVGGGDLWKLVFLRGCLLIRFDDVPQALQHGHEALNLARAHQQADAEDICLSLLSGAETDLARRGVWKKQFLEVATNRGHRPNRCTALCNLGAWYLTIGLHTRARALAEEALQLAESLHLQISRIFSLHTIGGTLYEIGDLPAALACLQQGSALARETNSQLVEGRFLIRQAIVLLHQRRIQPALDALRRAEELLEPAPALYAANCLAGTALATALAGDAAAARRLVTQTLLYLTPENIFNLEWPVEECLWWCYLVLTAPVAGDAAPPLDAPLDEEAWHILALAHAALLAPLTNLADAGLQRSYLQRHARRQLLQEWLRWAPSQVGPEAVPAWLALVRRQGQLQDIFRRLLAASVRLNAVQDLQLLGEQIVDEVAELTGAERIALVLTNAAGERYMVRTALPLSPPPFGAATTIPSPDPAAFLAEIEPWLAEVELHRQGAVRYVEADGPLAAQRSILLAPLLHHTNLVGLLYCDLPGWCGRFEVEDLELLGVLANQVAVAIANAVHLAELTAALEKVKRADQLKDEFLAAVSHELRTPLVSVISMADMLEEQNAGPMNDRQLSYTRAIQAGGDRLLALVNNILRYTSLIGGRVQVQLEPCRLEEICNSVLHTVRKRASTKQVAVESCIAPGGLTILSDSTTIVQMLQHLLDNALKFTSAGGRIGLDAHYSDDQTSVQLVIWDTGIGIAPEQQGLIFQPLRQLDGGLSRRYEGIGLGLSSAQRMVELLGGTIAVTSALGQGSCFTVTLPRQGLPVQA